MNTNIGHGELADRQMLGSGAFGAVYKAVWRSNSVAVKYFNQKFVGDDQFETLSLLQYSDNIIKLLGTGTEGLQTFVVMELAPFSLEQGIPHFPFSMHTHTPHTLHSHPYSLTLTHTVSHTHSLYCFILLVLHDGEYQTMYTYQVDHVMSWALQLALALECCHDHDVIHRDIKPPNLLLFDEGRLLKICDFGTGTTELLEASTFIGYGTPYYLAPEVIEGKHTYACDIYSFAITLWEMITRHKPTLDLNQKGAPHPYNIFRNIGKGLRPPTIVGIPKFLWELITRCWSQEPNKRLLAGDIVNKLESAIGKFRFKCDLPLIDSHQKNLEDAIMKGSVKFRITKAVVQGEARVGKTSLKCLLLRQPYDKLSTSCIEAPQVAYGNFSINRFGCTDKCWTLVEDDELSDKVLAELKLIAADTKEAKEGVQPDTIDAKSEPDTSVPGHYHAPTATPQHDAIGARSKPGSIQHVTTSDDKQVSESLASDQAESLASDEAIATENTHLYEEEAIAQVKELYEQCKRVHRKEGLSLHLEWLHFIDSGGQIQFQKLLPAFMPWASVLILVLNLAKSLSDPSSTVMQLEHDQQISVSEYSLTVEEILKQLISAIALSTKQFISNEDPVLSKYMKPPKEKLNIVAVATHRDKYDQLKEKVPESLKVKEAKLKQIFDSVSNSCFIVRGNPPQHNILHEVDGSKATCGKFDDLVVEQIALKLKDQAYEIEVPIKWYCLSVLLHKVARKGCGVLSVPYCQALGKQLNISGEEVIKALKFFNTLNMSLYYPDSPVADMVFVRLDSLINIIRELVIWVCITRDNWLAAEDDVKEFATKGFLSVKVLEKLQQTYSKVSSVFPEFGGKLLSLFQHLLLAACLQETNKFFMPALLPVKDVSDANPFPKRTPLLFAFKNAVPMGLFCAFIVHLLSLKQDLSAGSSSDRESSMSSDDDDGEKDSTSSHNQWQIITEDLNCSNYFTLQNNNMEGIFVFVERLNCIELHAEYPTAQVVKVAKDIIDDTVKKWGLKESRARNAFYCSCSGGGGMRHIAVVQEVKSTRKHVLFCKKGGKKQSLDVEKSRWFNHIGNGKGTSLSAAVQSRLEEEPVLRDVTEQLVPIASKWHELGLALNLKSHELDPLKETSSVIVRLSKVLEKWKENTSPPYTWATIMAIVSGPFINNKDVYTKIAQFLETTQDS